MADESSRGELPRFRGRVPVLAAALAIGAIELAVSPVPPVFALALMLAGPLVAAVQNTPRGAEVLLRALRDRDAEKGSRAALLAGLIFVLAALSFLEWRDPYYFTQDDNYSLGPVALAACRGFFETGELPSWNPYQFLGQPTTVQSMFGLTYPLTYVAFAMAHALGRDQLFLELFVLMHVIGGYFAMYWAARSLRIRPPLAVAASISFVLCGTALMTGRSYATMTPLYFWMPMLVVLTERLRRSGGSLRWAIAVAVAAGAFCHSGNGQMWLYGMMFFGGAIVLYFLCGTGGRADAAWVAVAAVFSIGLTLILVIPQLWFMRAVEREGGVGQGIWEGIAAMLLPMPLVAAEHPQGWGDPDQMAAFYYAGTVLTVAALLGMVVLAGAAIALRGVRPIVRDNVWLLCAAAALWIALGPDSAPWPLMSRMPVLNKMNGPWKLLLFFHMFAALAGAQILDRLFRRRAALVAAVVTAVLVFWGVIQTRTAFYDYGDDPYPPLRPAMTDLLKRDPESVRGRVLPIAPERVATPGYARSMMLDFPSWYGIGSVDGYDPFVRALPEYQYALRKLDADILGAAKAYSVRWMVVHHSSMEVRRSVRRRDTALEYLVPARAKAAAKIDDHAKLRLKDAELMVFEIPNVDPLAFPLDEPRHVLPVKLKQSGVIVDVGGPPRPVSVVVNFLLLNGIVARAGGNILPMTADEWGRIVVDVPAGTRVMEVRYEPPWDVAALASFCVLLAGAVGAVLASQLRPKAPS